MRCNHHGLKKLTLENIQSMNILSTISLDTILKLQRRGEREKMIYSQTGVLFIPASFGVHTAHVGYKLQHTQVAACQALQEAVRAGCTVLMHQIAECTQARWMCYWWNERQCEGEEREAYHRVLSCRKSGPWDRSCIGGLPCREPLHDSCPLVKQRTQQILLKLWI